MKELLEMVRSVLEYTGSGRNGSYPLGEGCAKVRALREAVDDALDSGLFEGRVTREDLLDVPGMRR